MTVHMYTDASFNNIKLVGVSGFIIFKNDEEHKTGVIPSSLICTMKFPEKTNIRAELRGAILALEAAGSQKNISKINLYTDCEVIPNLLKRRKKLESVGFMSGRKKEILSNADLYQKLFALYDQLHPTICWVKGHTSKKNQTLIQKNFSHIDKIVRKELRRVTKT